MAQLDGGRLRRQPSTPRTPKSPTIEQLLRGSESEKWSPMNSPPATKDNDMEHDPCSNHKKSVLTKVKEKAKKWRQGLSKKKHVEGENNTPSWGVRLDEEEEEEEEEDPEYLGAPMYESELAPEGYKEAARQHPRAVPMIAEKHVLTSSVKFGGQRKEERPSSSKSNNNTRTLAKSVTMKLTPAVQEHPLSETPKLVASKLQTFSISTPATTESDDDQDGHHKAQELDAQETADNSTTQETETLGVTTENQRSSEQMGIVGTGNTEASLKERNSPRDYMWDKGVSMKEYMAQKFQPGEDEKALSRIISEVMSPRTSLGDVGLVGKVKGAVNSLFWSEGSAQPNDIPAVRGSSPQIPISTNAHEVAEEENDGRILQAN